MLTPWTKSDPWPDDCHELLVVGPPGTGKTTALLSSYVWPALGSGGVVLATSYSRAAANELRVRTSAHLGREPEAYRRNLSTIHSEAARRCSGLGLRGFGAGVDVQADDIDGVHARIADEEASDALDAWEYVRQRHPEDIGQPIRDRLARKLSGRGLDLAETAIRRLLDGWYDEDGRLVTTDFTGLLELALTHGSDRAVDLLAIDEAQDCTPLQWALVDRWASTADRLLVVGDPDQSIYGWAAADGRRLLRWLRDERPARYLAQSYRVPRTAYRLARSVILQVPGRVDAPYAPADRDGEVRATTPEQAIGAVAREAGSVLLLARTGRQCAALVDELTAADIPHIAEKGKKLLGGKTLRQVEALTDLLAGRPVQPAAAKAIVQALRSPGPAMPTRGMKSLALQVLSVARDSQDLRALGVDVEALRTAWADVNADWLLGATLERECSVADMLVVRGWLLDYPSTEALLAAAGRVVVVTCHGSKGRQADLVIVDARATCRAWTGHGSDDERHEDRRVMYVALTRTLDRMLIVRGQGKDWLDQQGIRVNQ